MPMGDSANPLSPPPACNTNVASRVIPIYQRSIPINPSPPPPAAGRRPRRFLITRREIRNKERHPWPVWPARYRDPPAATTDVHEVIGPGLGQRRSRWHSAPTELSDHTAVVGRVFTVCGFTGTNAVCNPGPLLRGSYTAFRSCPVVLAY